MSPSLVLSVIGLYFLLLLLISWITGRKAGNEGFFLANRKAPWYLIAFGMIGASLSGVTFMSVPGWVRDTQFTYMMVVLGYLAGYIVIATILLPLYYKLNLTSIYTYLGQRFGKNSYKTGSAFFILSRSLGASLRIFLVIYILHIFVFSQWNIPFFFTACFFLILILVYTYQGGVKTIIWTDTLQTFCLLLSVVLTIKYVLGDLHIGVNEMISQLSNSDLTRIIDTDPNSRRFYIKQFLSGMFITITMTGLDQEMMQKNLSCKTLRGAQTNMLSFSVILVFVNLMFLFLGAILLIYAQTKGIAIPTESDTLFPIISIQYLKPVAGIVFLIGIISAIFPSADGALTSLTTSFCIDILGFKKETADSNGSQIKTRKKVHLGFAVLLLLLVVFFKQVNDKAIIDKLFTIAGYTYGPLLGLYSFGLFTRLQVKDRWVPYIAVASPLTCWLLDTHSQQWLGGYKFGFELLILNGALTFLGLWLIRKKSDAKEIDQR
jgi:Na+/proline symporter